MRPLHRTAALAALLVLAGCGQGGDDGKEAQVRTHPPTTRTPSSSAPAATHTTHAPPRRHPSKAPGPLPAAADGTDTSACGDGSCEVEVRGGVRLRLGGGADPGTFTVTAVAGGMVTVKSAVMEASTASGGVIQLNSVKITVRGVRGHRAVVRVTTG
jgi:hypothetical protein